MYRGQGNVLLPVPQSNQLGILWPHTGTEKQGDWPEVTQPLALEQDSQQVCGAIRNVFLHQYKRDESKMGGRGNLKSRMEARAPSLFSHLTNGEEDSFTSFYPVDLLLGTLPIFIMVSNHEL